MISQIMSCYKSVLSFSHGQNNTSVFNIISNEQSHVKIMTFKLLNFHFYCQTLIDLLRSKEGWNGAKWIYLGCFRKLTLNLTLIKQKMPYLPTTKLSSVSITKYPQVFSQEYSLRRIHATLPERGYIYPKAYIHVCVCVCVYNIIMEYVPHNKDK